MTNYHFESLGPEGFQQLCQSIISALNPNAVCYPLGMSDGGRDAAVVDAKTGKKIVYQVKYLRDPSSKDARRVVLDTIRTESEKIALLREQGFEEYYLLTNAQGSGKPGVGSIDAAEVLLSSGLDIPAHCWWRDDLSMRLNNLPEIKWSFIDLIKGGDIIRQLIMAPGQSRSEDAATKAIEAYVSSQRVRESHLKFKQIDLAKGLLDLFTDVPALLEAPSSEDAGEGARWFQRELGRCGIPHAKEYDEGAGQARLMVGAMQLLSNPKFAAEHASVVIEGAPGQGKSTVTQYLCQLHRLLLLNRVEDLKLVSSDLIPKDVRIPFRIDLRDYANWLLNKNPFSETYSDPLPSGTSPVLERFIAAQVSRFAGSDFSVSDLRWIAGKSKILIVLDGFDEVADISLRARIVSEATEALERLRHSAISCQLIVTSRPTAFADSPGFPRGGWEYIKLLPLSQRYIAEYTERWLAARGADPREMREMRAALNDSMRHAHVRDLARNPMQLSILLALMNVQGVSLPNKRTSLYDKYIDVFFNRETEKSRVIRDNRDLIIQMHGYIAWVLQVDAEENGAGNISSSKLREVVRAYLERHGYPTNALDELFVGVTERVVALVSRVEGTFEFEVQPLREYFAARYIYDSAPYVVAALDKGGTKPDRFRALICNFFWRNVARFYAGCYSSGELASIVEGLAEIGEDALLRDSAYPARLGVELLVDHVFGSQPRLAERLLAQISIESDLPVLASVAYRDSSLMLSVPEGVARSKLCELLKGVISPGCPKSYLFIYGNIISLNMTMEEKQAFLIESSIGGVVDSHLLRSIGATRDLSCEFLSKIEVDDERNLAKSLFFLNRFDVLESRSSFLDAIFDEFMSAPFFMAPRSEVLPEGDGVLRFVKVASVFSDYRMWDHDWIKGDGSEKCFGDLSLARLNAPSGEEIFGNLISISSIDYRGRDWARFDRAYDSFLNVRLADASRNLDVVSELIESARDILGDCNALCRFAVSVAYLWPKEVASSLYEIGEENLGLLDMAMIYASRREFKLWEIELARLEVTSSLSGRELMAIAGMFSGLSVEEILALSGRISRLLDMVPATSFEALHSLIEEVDDDDIVDQNFERLFDGIDVSPRFAYCIMPRLHSEVFQGVWAKFLSSSASSDSAISSHIIDTWIERAQREPAEWGRAARAVKENFALNNSLPYFHSTPPNRPTMPIELAREICRDALSYPPSVVAIAVSRIDAEVGGSAVRLGKIAAEQAWLN